jgi:hypothetical protein
MEIGITILYIEIYLAIRGLPGCSIVVKARKRCSGLILTDPL